MHSKETGSQIDHPHSLVFHPIHRDPDNYESDIVAVTAAGFAWDASLRNLLPSNVNGIVAEILNNCNQSYTYE